MYSLFWQVTGKMSKNLKGISMPANRRNPFTIEILKAEEITLSAYDSHVTRCLSSMKGQFRDTGAFEGMLAREDVMLYEVYEILRPALEGELLEGISILRPGKVGEEYFMTKGHFHAALETGEVYFCLRGEGRVVMETPEGDWAVETLRPNQVLYIPPRWAHRSVNVSPDEDLVTFFVYPAQSGHDYGSIEKQGFRKLVVEREEIPVIVDNPHWIAPENR
jgi:glucose-6-phosphate isomerase